MYSVSDKRVYQYVRVGRLPARRIRNILIVPIDEVRHFKPSPSGRVRAKIPPWRAYRSRGALILTDMQVPVRAGQQGTLVVKLKAIQKADSHTFPGTVARYVVKDDEALTSVQMVLIWKSTEMPSETKCAQGLAFFQEELADVLNCEATQYRTNEAIIHT